MKKLFTILALSAVLILSVAPAVMAQPNITDKCCQPSSNVIWKSGKVGETNCSTDFDKDNCTIKGGMIIGPTKGSECSPIKTSTGEAEAVELAVENWSLVCLIATVYTVTNWIFFLMMALAVVLIVIGGAMYMLSGGDTTKAGKGKSLITYALIGLVIALVAKFVPPIVKFILGVS